jgi:hypothetical protein
LQEIVGISCRALRRGRLLGIAAALMSSACTDPPPAVSGECGTDGKFEVRLYGSLDTALDWGAQTLRCQGMPRPNGAGARLRFSGSAQIDAQKVPIAFIFGIPDLQRGQVAKELPTNVTIIDESQGRFFATQNIEACWSDIDSQEAADSSTRFIIKGILYCVTPLPELHGPGSVQFTELQFVGQIDWKQPE